MRLFHKNDKVQYRIAVAIGLFLGLFLFIGIHNYLHWHGGSYSGTVTQVTETSLVITDANGRERTIDTDETTRIRRGPRSLEDGLRVGDRIIVIGDVSSDRHIHATLIRIIGSPYQPAGTTTPN